MVLPARSASRRENLRQLQKEAITSGRVLVIPPATDKERPRLMLNTNSLEERRELEAIFPGRFISCREDLDHEAEEP